MGGDMKKQLYDTNGFFNHKLWLEDSEPFIIALGGPKEVNIMVSDDRKLHAVMDMGRYDEETAIRH